VVDDTSPEEYLKPEAKARLNIDSMLRAAGWDVQDFSRVNLGAARGVAVREFPMAKGHGQADYLLFVGRMAVGEVEAKREGSTLTGVEWQSAKYTTGLPQGIPAVTTPLPFAYESTGVETKFTNGLEPIPRSRNVYSFLQPDTLAEVLDQWKEDPERATLRSRIRFLPELITDNLRSRRACHGTSDSSPLVCARSTASCYSPGSTAPPPGRHRRCTPSCRARRAFSCGLACSPPDARLL
jgi:hypothetical protein